MTIKVLAMKATEERGLTTWNGARVAGRSYPQNRGDIGGCGVPSTSRVRTLDRSSADFQIGRTCGTFAGFQWVARLIPRTLDRHTKYKESNYLPSS